MIIHYNPFYFEFENRIFFGVTTKNISFCYFSTTTLFVKLINSTNN